MVLEKTLESPLTARRSNQSVLKEINSEYSLEGLMLKLKLQYFGHPMRRADSLEKTLMPGPGKYHGRRSLVGYSPWRCKESDTTESLHFHFALGVLRNLEMV